MRIFVTGATGFIGRHFCERLVREGHSVVALVRNKEKARALPASSVECVEGDLSSFKDASFTLPPCDAVVHLAGVVAAKTIAEYNEINFAAVSDLVECIGRQSWKPQRLLFASSLAAGGPSAAGRPKTEDDGAAPIDPYGRAKLEAETLLQHAPFPTTSFRPSLVLGPEDAATLTLFQMAARGLGFGVAGKNPELSYVYVDDLVDALMALLADTSDKHRTYYVAHPQFTDTRTLWNTLGKSAGKRVFILPIPKPALFVSMLALTALSKVFRFQNQLDRKQYEQITASGFTCSSEALHRDFGWTPRYDLDAAVHAAAEGFRAAGQL